MMRLLPVLLLLSLATPTRAANPTAPEPPSDAPAEAIRSAVVPDAEGGVVAEVQQAASPVPVPPMAHYAALWERSMFTTRALPAPEMPQGPGFADQLVLAGMYEVDGAMVAVILDKLTAQISEARIGSDNAQGIRIKTVEPAGESGLGRVQLQKGMQSGWIQFADASAAAPAASSPAAASPLSGNGMDARPPSPPPDAGLTPPGAPAINPAAAPPAVVQPLPGIVNPPLPSSPNPGLDDIPLPPE